MTAYRAIIVITVTLLSQAICAPKAKTATNKIGSTFTTPANLSYEELMYIAQVRIGEDSTAPKSLSPCARAILGCCNQNTINESCSEKLGCGAFFFDNNPCDDKFVIDALNAAKTFYKQFNSV